MVDRTVSERLESSRRRDTVSIDNSLRVDFLVDEFLGLAQKLGSKDGDGGGTVTNFVVLDFRNVDEHFGRRVVESYGFEDCGAVIGHHYLSGRAVCRDSSLGRFRIAHGGAGRYQVFVWVRTLTVVSYPFPSAPVSSSPDPRLR